MRKAFAAGALTLGLMVSAAPALAASDAQTCEAQGGTFTNDSGTKSCALPVGNSDNTKTTSQKGSFSSSHPSEFRNPGGNQPPGQQG